MDVRTNIVVTILVNSAGTELHRVSFPCVPGKLPEVIAHGEQVYKLDRNSVPSPTAPGYRAPYLLPVYKLVTCYRVPPELLRGMEDCI